MQVILGYSSDWYPPLDPAARRITLCSSFEVNSGLFLSARLLPETKSSQDELEAMWAFTCAWVSCGCLESEKHYELRRENWTSCWVHTDYFNREYLFWTWLHVKVDTSSFLYIYFPCLWDKCSQRFMLFYLHVCEERWPRPSRQRMHPVYFLYFTKAHCFVVMMTVHKLK